MPTLVVYTTVPQEQALATLRYHAAAEALDWKIIAGKEGTDTIYPQRVHQADVVLVQRDFPRFFSAYQQIIKETRKAGKRLLYDLDDLLIALPANHPNHSDYKDAPSGIMHAILTADQVIVSSPLLREILLPVQPQITIWPTVLPDALWKIRPTQPVNPETPLKIGYMGGTSHIPDMNLLVHPLRQILETWSQPIELHFWECPPPRELAAYPQTIHHSGISNYADFATAFSTTVQADIWLAPLQPTLFNRCKSPIKFWEYSAINGVGIYSDIDPYRSVVHDGKNGLLANSSESWVAAITKLANNPALRLQLAANAQQKLRDEGFLSTHLQAWKDIYTASSPSTNQQIPQTLLSQSMVRFSEQAQQRADERHYEVVNLVQDVLVKSHQNENLKLHLKLRNRQLDEIHGSHWWRNWQRLKRIVHLDFSPIPPFQPYPLPNEDN